VSVYQNALETVIQRGFARVSHCLFKRSAFLSFGGCDERIFSQDHSLFYRFAALGPLAQLHHTVCASPQDEPNRIMNNKAQVQHDSCLALAHILTETPSLPPRLRSIGQKKLATRAWRWARKQQGPPLSLPIVLRYVASRLLTFATFSATTNPFAARRVREPSMTHTVSSEKEVTFILTSCGRVDLLEKTLNSFEKYNTYPIKRAIITEDSCDPDVYAQVRALFGDRYEILANESKKGQIKSITDAYETIDTPYVFHCEDDWEFTRSGFIEESFEVLDHDPKIIQAWLESQASANSATNNIALFTFSDTVALKNTSFHKMNVAEGWEWGYFSFRPSLKRMADYHHIGGYEKFTNELDISCTYRELGYYCVILETPVTIDLGTERHVSDPTRIWPKRRKSGKPKGIKRLWGHIKRLLTEGKW